MKIFNKYNIVFSTVLGVLVGCGGDSSSSSHKETPSPSPRWNQITSQDVNYKIPLAVASTVDLTNYTQAINSGASLTLTGFEQIGDRLSCTQYQIKQTQVVFEMGSAQECYYQYTMQDAESGSTSSAMLRVAASSLPIDQSVRQFSAVTQIDDVVGITVNDGTTVPEGYVIDEKSIQVLGQGSAQINKLNSNVIDYHAGREQSSQGLHRVVFSYINPDNQSVIQGLVDVAVGSTVQNYAPKTVNFRYGDPASYIEGQQLKYIYIEEGQEVTINIAEYYNQGYLDAHDQLIELLDDNGLPIFDEQMNRVHYYLEPDGVTSTPIYQPGNFLIDRDKDRLQLTDVFVYDAYANIASKDFTNTAFTFKSYKQGTYYVTYVLSDHNGGYGTGIIQIKVGEEIATFIPPWDRLLHTETNKFKAPITRYDADYQDFEYSTVTEENGTEGPDGWGTPLFDYSTAELLCSQADMRLPKLNELTALKNTYPDGLYNSLDVYNLSEGKRQKKVNWPTSAHFWARSESGMDTTSAVKLDSSFNEENSIPMANGEQRAVICIDRGPIIDITVNPSLVDMRKGNTQKLQAITTYSDSTTSDSSSSVTWTVANSDIATITQNGLLVGASSGSTYLTATKNVVTSNTVIVNVCNTLADACIDVFDAANGKLFTSSPSVAFLNSIGGSELVNNTYYENGTLGPHGDFSQFSVIDGRALCDIYSTKNIGGRINWRLATKQELMQLYNTYGGMFFERAWPTTASYSSDATANGDYYLVSLNRDFQKIFNPRNFAYISCVSNP